MVLLARLVERMASGGGMPLRSLVLAVISTAWLVSLARGGVSLWQSQLVLEIWQNLSNALLGRLLHQPYSFHLQHGRSELSTRLQVQLAQLRTSTLMPLIQACSNAATVLLLSSGLWLLAGPGSLLVVLVVVGSYGLQVLLLRPVLQRQKCAVMHAEMESSHLVLDALNHIRRLLLEAGQRTVLARNNELTRRIVRNASWAGVLPQLPRQLVEPLGLTAILLFLQIPNIRSNGSAALPWLALVTLGMLRLSQPLQHLAQSFSELQAGRPLLAELLPLLELPLPSAPAETTPQQRPPGLAWRQLQLQRVSLRYSATAPWVLHGLELKLIRGECLALVGASGSGKTSLAAVLLGLLAPQEGQLLLDGTPLHPTTMANWKRQCAEVGQPAKLLRGSVRTNLSGWSEPPAEAVLWHALEQVDLRERVEGLPQGLESEVREDGRGWSGGEQQRLALAAALLRQPGLMVLDEATSGVEEARAEQLIRRKANLPERPAVVVITHREAVMRCCDRVVVMDQGRIVADGPFAELKQACSALQVLLAQDRH